MQQEKAIVTFKNPETNDQIEISLSYNKETSDLDYDINFGGYQWESKMDFPMFLAKMFLNSLQVEDNKEDKKDE